MAERAVPKRRAVAAPPKPLRSTWAPIDLRGQLPVRTGARPYYQRPLSQVVGVTCHYTAAPPAVGVYAVANYQISPGAQEPFPSVAYTLFVEQDGQVYRCHDLETRVWHSGAVVGGVARNVSHVGVCYAGNREPNTLQLIGIRQAILWCQEQLGRELSVEGHRDAPYSTSCPGPEWPKWRTAVLP